jgi:hypothetical protein
MPDIKITDEDWKAAVWPLTLPPGRPPLAMKVYWRNKMHQVDSTTEERTEVTNNVMRHKYRTLSEKEARHMTLVKDKGLEFVELLYDIGGRPSVEDSGHANRELSIAATKIEEAVMWATKSITK